MTVNGCEAQKTPSGMSVIRIHSLLHKNKPQQATKLEGQDETCPTCHAKATDDYIIQMLH